MYFFYLSYMRYVPGPRISERKVQCLYPAYRVQHLLSRVRYVPGPRISDREVQCLYPTYRVQHLLSRIRYVSGPRISERKVQCLYPAYRVQHLCPVYATCPAHVYLTVRYSVCTLRTECSTSVPYTLRARLTYIWPWGTVSVPYYRVQHLCTV
jgi:hypothetical protein